MANLSQVELQNLRHLIGMQDTNFQKLTTMLILVQIHRLSKYLQNQHKTH